MPALPAADVLMSDGTVAVIRPLDPRDDAEIAAVEALHDRVSDESLRLRFFSAGRGPAHSYVEHLRDSTTTRSLVAEVGGEVVALATAERVSDDTDEVAFLVDDRLGGRGLGSLLLEHLAADARDRGVRRVTAEVLPENRPMLHVFLDAGFDIARRMDSGVVLVDLDPSATDDFLAASDDREARSEARSLAPLLHPASVAVAGARRDGTGVGAAVLRSIRAGGFTGRLSVIHPSAGDVAGVPAYASLADVPEPVDLVVVAVPATSALATLRDAAAAGVRAAVVISSGFKEMGAEGAAVQQQMVALARSHSMRLVGPNCLGLVVNGGESQLNATFHDVLPPVGGLAVASQSGGVGIVLMDLARRLGLGINTFVSLGNKADVSSNDLLAAWRDDPAVTAAALYLESFGNARKFARIAREFSEHKPLLAVMGGRSRSGQRAGASHTAASASSAIGVAALFAQAGVIACDGAEDLAETALLVAEQPLPRGTRLGVISNAGGMGVLAADAADAVGLTVPELSPALAERLGAHVLDTVGTSNPVDVGAGGSAADLAAVAGDLMASDELDALLVVVVATGVSDATASIRAVARVRAEHPDKPVVLVPMGGVDLPDEGTPGITRFGSVVGAVRALARAARYRAWRDVERPEPVRSDPALARRTRAAARTLLEVAGDGFLGPSEIGALLGDYGLSPVGTAVEGPAAAGRAAAATGFPVAVKVADPTVVHKTDRGLVRVGLTTVAQVEEATREMGVELGVDEAPVLVQPMSQGVELALGLVQDPVFGPLVMVAAGGVATDVWDDRVFLMPPVTARDASRALRGLRVWPLLDGYRGTPRADVAALEDLVLALGRLALDVPEVAELDLNPVLAGPERAVLVDVKVRLAHPVGVDAAAPRQLRRVR
jgi:acyl-CoA synthetase (NDP forming)/GNAT superfamily N-acetyltransferase